MRTKNALLTRRILVSLRLLNDGELVYSPQSEVFKGWGLDRKSGSELMLHSDFYLSLCVVFLVETRFIATNYAVHGFIIRRDKSHLYIRMIWVVQQRAKDDMS